MTPKLCQFFNPFSVNATDDVNCSLLRSMAATDIIKSWKKKSFQPLYWLEGEEDYYIDQIVDFAEHQLLPESEASFNLTVFYGRDADWAAVVNACRRYPMFAERQVVLLKEAQQMKDIDKLESYFEQPLASTIFVVAYKGKNFDKRTKFYKVISKQAEVFQSPKLREDQVPAWIRQTVTDKGYAISDQAIHLLFDHIGNDLNRISNEIDKLSVNLAGKKQIDEDDIEKYIGISKEFNVFELMGAVASKDMSKALRIIQYFEGNPKAGPIQMVLPAMYSNLSRIYSILDRGDFSEAALKPLFYYNPNSVRQAREIIHYYGPAGIEKMLLLLHQYNLKGVGVGIPGTESHALLKEMVVKMMFDA